MNLLLQITGKCNLRCKYCYFKDIPYENRMSEATLEKSIRFAFARTQQQGQTHCGLTFFGGEPLLEKSLIHRGVELAYKHLPLGVTLRFAINTNGTLLDAETLAFLREHGFRIYLSLDGPAEIQDEQRCTVGGGTSLDKILPWVEDLLSMDTYVIQVVDSRYADRISESLDYITGLGFRKIISAPNYDETWTADKIDLLCDAYARFGAYWVAENAAQRPLYWNVVNDKIRHLLEGFSVKESTCAVGLGGMAVNPLGRLFPCSHFLDTGLDGRWDLGSIDDGLDRDKMNLLSQHLRHDRAECMDCECRPRCHAQGCSCIAYTTTGLLDGISDQVCAMEKRTIELADHFGAELLN